MSDIIQQLTEAGLTGRGGAAFPSAIKVKAARENGARLIVNACDGEIGAAKDGWVVANHLDELIDGAGLITGAGHSRPIYAAHRGSSTLHRLKAAGLPTLVVPDRYVSSEETSLISLMHGGTARPLTKRAPFVFGGRTSQGKRIKPTVVLNAETVWRVSQVHHRGAEWFRSFGTVDEPGPRLMAVGGAVRIPGVYETAAGDSLMRLLNLAGGLHPAIRHVGVGGLGGIVLTADEARNATWDSPTMKAYGGSLGPGIITVWDPANSGPRFASAMIARGAAESAGQCGPCMFGLPALSDSFEAYIADPTPLTRRVLDARLDLFGGRGACHHPDGVARFARSALRVFGSGLEAEASGPSDMERTRIDVQYA